jgi:hypothetical protein
MPETDILLLANYVGVDRKLKAVGGQSLTIQAPTPTTKEAVYIEAHVSGSGILGLDNCNHGEIAWARTKVFTITGNKTLGASDFASSGGIGIQDSGPDPSPCVDDLAKKVSEGTGAAPPGHYTLHIILFKNNPVTKLAEDSHTIDIIASSTKEINLNLISPTNGEQVASSSPNFNWDAQKEGTLYVYEHSNSGQSAEDAVRSGGLLCLQLDFTQTGTGQATYLYPGNAKRPLQVGKKYSWYIAASIATGGGQPEIRKSPIYSFTVTSNDPNYTRLLNALSNAADPIGASFSNLLSNNYTLAYSSSNPIKMRVGGGSSNSLEISELLKKLNELAQSGVHISVQVGTE